MTSSRMPTVIKQISNLTTVRQLLAFPSFALCIVSRELS